MVGTATKQFIWIAMEVLKNWSLEVITVEEDELESRDTKEAVVLQLRAVTNVQKLPKVRKRLSLVNERRSWTYVTEAPKSLSN